VTHHASDVQELFPIAFSAKLDYLDIQASVIQPAPVEHTLTFLAWFAEIVIPIAKLAWVLINAPNALVIHNLSRVSARAIVEQIAYNV
jgi:hypothetical protein